MAPVQASTAIKEQVVSVRILVGDCRTRLAELPAHSVQTCVTSPPYFGLRDYGHDGQIGLEQTPDAFVAELVSVFREVRRVLRDDGTLWLNLGDSYCNSNGYARAQPEYQRKGRNDAPANDRDLSALHAFGLKTKDLIGIPWRVAFALQADGWYLRQDIIWHKPNPMPESVKDRCTKAHEYIFLLTKSERYYYDADAIREPHIHANDPRNDGRRHTYADDAKHNQVDPNRQRTKTDCVSFHPDGRNKRSVWTVTTKPFSGAHFATFPPDLIEPCIKAGSKPGDTILDPFGGAGTSGLVADRLGRNAVLCELNPAYAKLAADRLRADGGMLMDVTLLTDDK
jgi:DNA modification methylase